jgi:hypothetical protein
MKRQTRSALLTSAAVASLAAVTLTPAVAEPLVWHQDARFTVWQETDTRGAPECMFKAFHSTVSGTANWGFIFDPGLPTQFIYGEDGINWYQGGSVSVRIDHAAPFTAHMKPGTSQPSLLFMTLEGTSQATIRDFLNELTWGNQLFITTGLGTRTFSLAGSAAALQSFGQCMNAINPGGATPAPAPAPVPAVRPRYGLPQSTV